MQRVSLGLGCLAPPCETPPPAPPLRALDYPHLDMKKSHLTSERSNVCRKVGNEGLHDLGEVEHLFCAPPFRPVRTLRGRALQLGNPFYKRLTSPRSFSNRAYSIDYQYFLIDNLSSQLAGNREPEGEGLGEGLNGQGVMPEFT